MEKDKVTVGIRARVERNPRIGVVTYHRFYTIEGWAQLRVRIRAIFTKIKSREDVPMRTRGDCGVQF